MWTPWRVAKKPQRMRHVPVQTALSIRHSKAATLNRVPDLSDWRVGSRFVENLHGLGEQPFIHRKAWEYGICIEGLEQVGVVTPDAAALLAWPILQSARSRRICAASWVGSYLGLAIASSKVSTAQSCRRTGE